MTMHPDEDESDLECVCFWWPTNCCIVKIGVAMQATGLCILALVVNVYSLVLFYIKEILMSKFDSSQARAELNFYYSFM